MSRPDEIQWCPTMLRQIRPDAFPAIRPAAPEPSDPSFNRVDVSRLIEATRAKSLLERTNEQD